ncbi:MAG TPA: hypothetical protein VLF39_02920 [Candidatus Saccharimonadales bacterium]|nr:hypothetical protein [Candidatus Saccharimonadales bacterium]
MAINFAKLDAETTPAEGVFFWANEKGSTNRLIPDFYALGELALQIKDHTSVIASEKVDQSLKPALSESLESLVGELDEIMKNRTPGKLLIAAPESLRTYSRLDKILPDYEQLDDDGLQFDDQIHVLAIPTEKITATRALPYRSSENQYSPVLSLRVQTSSDKPLAIYDVTRPESVRYETNPGSWYDIPLNYVDLKLRPEPKA